jgi:hypothetical protein
LIYPRHTVFVSPISYFSYKIQLAEQDQIQPRLELSAIVLDIDYVMFYLVYLHYI